MASDLLRYRIRELGVCGFKSIALMREPLEIRPLTILAGANNSGKSAMMQPLLLLKQTVEATYETEGPLHLAGDNVSFTSPDQFLSRPREVNGERKLKIEIGTGGHAWLRLTFVKAPNSPFRTLEQSWEDDGPPYRIEADWTSEDVRSRFRDVDTVAHDRFWLRLVKAGSEDDLEASVRAAFATKAPIPTLSRVLQKILHVSGIRGNPERSYQAVGAGPNFPGTFQRYVASVIASWQANGNSNYDFLNRDLRHLAMTEELVARKLGEDEIDLFVSRLKGGKPDVSLADVGLGISHILPVLVALHTAEEGQMVYVEQPEIHLHPRAQVKLADILANAAKRGVRVVAETHSTLLLTAIQTLVAKRELSPELVKLHWFQRDPKTGVTEVTPTDLDESGAFVQGDWPEDFDDVILKADGAYLDAVESREAR